MQTYKEYKLQNLIEYKCSFCNKNYQQKFDKKVKERFFSTYKFSNNDNNRFISLLQKGVYPYKYMDDWEKSNETLLLGKKDFYSHFNIEDITDDADYVHAKRACNNFEIRNLWEYHDLYVQSDTLLSGDVFHNFRNIRLGIYELDYAKFPSAPGLAWQAVFKKTKVKLDLLTDIGMLLMTEGGTGGRICQSIYKYAKKI